MTQGAEEAEARLEWFFLNNLVLCLSPNSLELSLFRLIEKIYFSSKQENRRDSNNTLMNL